MPASTSKAVWQRTPCPPWCIVEHHDDDHAHDWRHQSESFAIPLLAVAEAHGSHPDGRDQWQYREFVICLQQRDGAELTEVYIGDGTDQRIAVDIPSALRLAQAIPSVLEALSVIAKSALGDDAVVSDQHLDGI